MRHGIAIAIAIVVLACGAARLPAPPFAPHPTSALQPVPYPAPSPRVESVPKPPEGSGWVWIDGEWIWQTRKWSWRRGRWVNPPPGAQWSPWTSIRDEDGNLFVATGVWRDAKGTVLPAVEPALATTEEPDSGTE